jgi:acetylornithine deacetylase/succinyl-diaminopimelate desuccinylase-like protein
MDALDHAVDDALPRLHTELFELLRLPSISTDPVHAADVRRTAEWLATRAERAGLAATIEETPGHPIVVARHTAGPAAPTLLVYGHYDVQPAEPIGEWRTPPFEPTVRDGVLYGRGVADDKSQVFLQLAAAELARAHGALPINLILLLEGEEEIGSPGLSAFVRENAEDLRADHVLIADSMMYAPGQPSLILGMRGMAYFEIEVRTGTHDLHSGQYGGAVPNPASVLATILSSLHDAERRVTLDGFYDDVKSPPPELEAAWRALPFDEAAFRAGAGGARLVGEPGYTTTERLWIRPALDVNGIVSGYGGPGKKTVLPASALAKLSCRLVPDQDPVRIDAAMRAHVARLAPDDGSVTVRLLQANRPWREDPDAPLYRAAAGALEEVFGRAPVLAAHGGTMPIAPELHDALSAPVAVMGFALPGANMHAPNEWFPLDHVAKGMKTMIRLYARLAAA